MNRSDRRTIIAKEMDSERGKEALASSMVFSQLGVRLDFHLLSCPPCHDQGMEVSPMTIADDGFVIACPRCGWTPGGAVSLELKRERWLWIRAVMFYGIVWIGQEREI